jgi:hypothetical protein
MAFGLCQTYTATTSISEALKFPANERCPGLFQLTWPHFHTFHVQRRPCHLTPPFQGPCHPMTSPSPCHHMDPPVFVLHPPLQTIVNTHSMFIIEPCVVGRRLQHRWHDLHFATRYVFCKKWCPQIMFEISLFLRCWRITPSLHLTSNNLF